MKNRIPASIISYIVTVLLILLGTVVLIASLPFILGRDLALLILRSREVERVPDPEVLEQIRQDFDLPTSAGESIIRILSGNMGHSWVDPSQTAYAVAYEGFFNSIILAFSATALALVLAIIIVLPRIKVAARGGSFKSWHILPVAILGSLPEFVLAAGIVIIFAVHLQWIAIKGLSIGPILALAIPASGMLGRIILITIDEVSKEEWVMNWRLNHVDSKKVIRAVVMQVSYIVAPQLSIYFAGLLASTALVETTFNIHGLGSNAVKAALNQDIPVLQVIALTVITIGIISALIMHICTRGRDTAATGLRVMNKPYLRWGWLIVLSPLLFLAIGYYQGDASISAEDRLLAPSLEHWFGTDQLGRDLFQRMAHGTIYTIGGSLLATSVCVLIALLLSVSSTLAPFVRRIAETFNALPAVLIGLLLVGTLGGGTHVAIIAVCVVAWIPLVLHGIAVADMIRATQYYQWSVDHKEPVFMRTVHHIIPAVSVAVIRHGASRIAHNALAIAGLGFLGVGASHDSPEWGVILSESINYAERAPWMIIVPTFYLIVIGITSAFAADTRLKN